MKKSERIVSHSDEELEDKRRRGGTLTDWKAAEALTHDEVEASIDFEEEGLPDWTAAIAGIPRPKQQVTVRFDPDIIAWFDARGPGYQTRIDAVLRGYMLAKSKCCRSAIPDTIPDRTGSRSAPSLLPDRHPTPAIRTHHTEKT
jgi:uncharacterized protein (DUF4415 family)